MTIEAKGDISNIEILADTKPLMLFIEFIKSVLQTRNRPFNLSDLGSELARIEMDSSTAGTNKFTVVFYPSDSFLRLAVAICAGDFKV